jgi:hypothetical protein
MANYRTNEKKSYKPREVSKPIKGSLNSFFDKNNRLKVKNSKGFVSDVVLDSTLEDFNVVNTLGITENSTVIEAISALVTGVSLNLYQGLLDCSAGIDYPAATVDQYWRVSVGGIIGTKLVETGDQVICIADYAGGPDDSKFMIVEKNISDISDLTDTTGLIPQDLSDLTDLNGLLNEAIPTTYANLIDLRNAAELEVGKKYLITDYVPVWNIFDGGTMNIEEYQAGIGEMLIVTAATSTTIFKEAISTTYPSDTIYYSLDLIDDRDIGFGDGAGNPIAIFKGMIYYRKDTIQNVETHYDFRNVKFRRWAVDAVAFDNGTSYAKKAVCKSSNGKIYKCITATTGEGDPAVNTADWILWLDITANAFVSWTADKTKFKIGNITTTNLIINNVTAGVDYDDFYTFGDWYNWVKNVSIGMIDLERTIKEYSYATQLNNIVFKTIDEFHTCFGNNIGSNCWNNTIGNKFYSNTIGNDFYSNTIGNKFYSNTIGNNFYSNAIGNDFYSNTIGNGFYSNTIGDAFNNNTIGEEFNYNTIGNYFGSNTIGNGFGSNTIGNYFYSNTIGNKFYYNTIGNNFKYNTIGNYFYSNTIGNGFGSNTIGDAFNNNTIGNNFSSNTTGNDFYKTIFGDNCQYNTIDNKINGTATDKIITFGNSITMCTIQDFAFGVLAADLNLTTASHIRGAYNTTIYQDKTDGVKLSYMDGGVPQYVDVTA